MKNAIYVIAIIAITAAPFIEKAISKIPTAERLVRYRVSDPWGTDHEYKTVMTWGWAASLLDGQRECLGFAINVEDCE